MVRDGTVGLHTIWSSDEILLIARTCFAPSSEPNAYLIAAAPALLDALTKLANEAQGFLAMADRDIHGHTNFSVLQERIDRARQAIAQAEGR